MSAVIAMMIGATIGAMAVAICNVGDERPARNPYAHLLGAEVEVDKFGDGNWERCVVVAVSWKGGVRVRRVSEMDERGHGNGFWMSKTVAPQRVRLV